MQINSRKDIQNTANDILAKIDAHQTKKDMLKITGDVEYLIKECIKYYASKKSLDGWEMANILRAIEWLYGFNHSFISSLDVCLYDILDANDEDEKDKNQDNKAMARLVKSENLTEDRLLEFLSKARA